MYTMNSMVRHQLSKHPFLINMTNDEFSCEAFPEVAEADGLAASGYIVGSGNR